MAIPSSMTAQPAVAQPPGAATVRLLVIGLTAFLTVVDLFATQAVLPELTAHFGVKPGEMGLAVNASTFGMAAGGLAVALLGDRIDRRIGIVLSLLVLAVPTVLLGYAPDLASFAVLRVVQGVLMSTAFTLMLAHLGERCSKADAAAAFAAYITGNVASNLVGRMVAAAATDQLGLAGNFQLFAALNLAGALLVAVTMTATRPMVTMREQRRPPLAVLVGHLAEPRLRGAFAIGSTILFAFIGTFTYVNFALVAPPLALSPMMLGVVYLVFLPSILTTPLAGRAVVWLGAPRTLALGLGMALLALPLLLTGNLAAVLTGLALVAIGTFLAQAVATGLVAAAARSDRAAASGLYLASYFIGGLVGSAILGGLFDAFGWPACVLGIAVALGVGLAITTTLARPASLSADRNPAGETIRARSL